MKEEVQTFGKYFCTFADSRYSVSLKRIEKQAHAMNIYDGIFIFDENKLNPDFREKFKDNLVIGSRGYGYWCWKPQIILQAFELISEGDVLQYSDTGCHLNPKGRDRLAEYFSLAQQSKNGILAFRTKREEEVKPGETFYYHNDLTYAKADLLAYFGVLNNIDLAKKPQYGGGYIFFRKEAKTIQFLNDWIKVFATDFSLLDDSPSRIQNHADFIEHRHDQSIFSLLCKATEVEELFSTEYFTEGDWNELSAFPIWSKRDKKIPWIKRKWLKIIKIKNQLFSLPKKTCYSQF
jgi:hypothetical protein